MGTSELPLSPWDHSTLGQHVHFTTLPSLHLLLLEGRAVSLRFCPWNKPGYGLGGTQCLLCPIATCDPVVLLPTARDEGQWLGTQQQ